MARPIAPTPRLDKESSRKFLNQVIRNASVKTEAVPTPKIKHTIRKIMADALREKK